MTEYQQTVAIVNAITVSINLIFIWLFVNYLLMDLVNDIYEFGLTTLRYNLFDYYSNDNSTLFGSDYLALKYLIDAQVHNRKNTDFVLLLCILNSVKFRSFKLDDIHANFTNLSEKDQKYFDEVLQNIQSKTIVRVACGTPALYITPIPLFVYLGIGFDEVFKKKTFSNWITKQTILNNWAKLLISFNIGVFDDMHIEQQRQEITPQF